VDIQQMDSDVRGVCDFFLAFLITCYFKKIHDADRRKSCDG